MSTPIPEGSVIITPTEVYREMQATHAAVQQVGTKVDLFVGTQLDHEARLRKVDGLPEDVADLKKTVVENHGPRLGKLEAKAAMYAGAAAVLGTAAGSLVTHLLSH